MTQNGRKNRKVNKELEQQVPDSKGQLSAANARLSKEITERKSAKGALERRAAEHAAELTKSMTLLETVTSNAPVILFATDAQGIFTVHTGKAVPATRRQAGEIIGKNYREVHFYNSQAQDNIRRALDGEAFTAIIEGPDDTAFETLYTPLRDAEGKITGMIGLSFDITGRQRAEAALRESQALTTTIVDSTSDMIWSVDPKTFGLLTFNRSVKDHFLRRGVQLQTGMLPEDIYTDHALANGWRGLYQRALSKDSYTVDYASPTDGILQVTLNRIKRDGKVFGISAFGKDVTDRKRAEAALQESETAFRTLAESVPQLVWMCTPDGLNVYFNQRWVDYTGLTLEESYGRGWNTPFHPDDQQPAWDAWNRAVATGETYSIERRLRRADGAYRWFLTRGVPLRDFAGEIVKWFGTCTDIDDLKRAEVEQRRLNRALRSITECNQAMVRAREESELLQEICRILVQEGGYRLAWVGFAEQDEAKTVRPVAHAGVEKGYLETMKITWADTERGRGPTGTAIRTGQPAICADMLKDPAYAPWREEAIRRGFGSSISLPMVLEGQPAGVLTAYAPTVDAFDATETQLLIELASDLAYGIQALRTRAARARAQEALHRANAYNRSLIEASLDPLVTISPDGKITDVNRSTEQVTGLPREELIGTDFTKYFTDPDMARGGYEQVLREGWVQDFALEILRCDGHITPVEYNASVYRDEAGQVIGVFAAARDITERKRMEEELSQLPGRVLEAHDQERRRIARELHDSTIQNLAAIALELGSIQESTGTDPACKNCRKYISESIALTELSLNELRNVSYLLHPPLLEDLGLASALEHYAGGFTGCGKTPAFCFPVLRRADGEPFWADAQSFGRSLGSLKTVFTVVLASASRLCGPQRHLGPSRPPPASESILPCAADCRP